ncbi:hypothetical protein AAHC03_01503 [Spirometra sp. Aus1]
MCPQRTKLKTKNRRRDMDQICADKLPNNIDKRIAEATQPDEDKPALGQYFCLTCDLYFCNASALSDHQRRKPHKRRLKALQEEPHTQEDADWAAGVFPTKRFRVQNDPSNPEKLPSPKISLEPSYVAVD